MKRSNLLQWALLLVLLLPLPAKASPDAAVLYQTHCASCHGKQRLGLTGPALLPQNLVRLRKKQAHLAIVAGLAATQMPAFGKKLEPDEIDALVKLIYTPLARVPPWEDTQIANSRVVTPEKINTDKPLWKADPLNLFVVVESGDHHVTILDGDKFTPLTRFKSRYALHGGPKFTSDGRYVFFGSRDGWITKYDLYTLQIVAEVRAGINMRNIAVSSNDKYVMAANYLPHTLVLFDARDLSLIKVLPVTSGNKSSRVSAVYNAPPRKSFIIALKDIKELWEFPYAKNSAWQQIIIPGSERLGMKREKFPIRRIKLHDYLDDFFFSQDYSKLMGASRPTGKAVRKGQVIDMKRGHKIAELDLPGMPHLGSGITFDYKGHRVMATPDLRGSDITVIDLENWKVLKKIKTKGPGFFMRSHENTPYAWSGPFFGPNRDQMHIIDKRTLKIIKTLQPVPGKTFAHVEFDRTGSHALVSLWEKDGALLVYDAKSFKLIKRLPMSRPAGKYNVWNKTRFSEGTSH